MKALKIVKKPESVMSEIAQAILKGSIEGGVEITQNELAVSLGVSRMPVREALVVLEELGLVERLHNQHIKVTSINEEFFSQIFSLMAVVVTGACDIRALQKNFTFQDESAFFFAVLQEVQNPFFRHLLKNFCSVFLSFVLASPTHDCKNGLEQLRQSLSTDTGSLKDYFALLAADAWSNKKIRGA